MPIVMPPDPVRRAVHDLEQALDEARRRLEELKSAL